MGSPAPANVIINRLPLALIVCAVHMFVVNSRLIDYVPGAGRVHLPSVTLFFVLLAVIASGAWRVVMTPIGFTYVFLCFWMGVSALFSEWHGGSLKMIKVFLVSSIVLIPLAGIPRRVQHLRVLFYTFPLAVWCLIPFTFIAARDSDRLALAGGMYGNANDLALIMCLSLPFWWFMLQDLSSGPAKTFAFLFGILPTVLTALRTGSRAGLLALVLVGAFIFFNSTMRAKLLMLTGGTAVVFFALLLSPDTLFKRYRTIFESAAVTEDQLEAVQSTAHRKELLKDSLRYMWQHPVFGLGPGQFVVVRGKERDAEGLHGMWLSTHNAYTQLASECGIPVLLAYLAILGWSLVNANKIRRMAARGRSPELHRVWAMAAALQAALMGLAVMAFFLSLGYQGQIFTLAGLTIALAGITRQMPEMAPSRRPMPQTMPRFAAVIPQRQFSS